MAIDSVGGSQAPQTDLSMGDVNNENTKQIQNILLQARLTEQRNIAETIGKTIKGGSEAVKGLA